MANVNIKFNGKDFLLSCEDGQEAHLEELSEQLNQKFENLKKDLGNIGENKLLLITTIQLIDEYFDLKQKVTNQKNKLDEISNKFKEIRSLAIKYKEIIMLKKEQDKFKSELENLNNGYEKIIDDASNQIEEFITKNNFS